MYLVIVGLAAIPLVIYLVAQYKKGRCHSKANLAGKTAIITGANSGVGYFTALDLARRNARVILACRNIKAGFEAALKISQETGNTNVVCHHLDVSLMSSVRVFSEWFLESEARLDILINNAGIGNSKQLVTAEGIDTMYATNHFGHFLLTHLLLDRLKSCQPSRVVVVSSSAHTMGVIKFDEFHGEGKPKSSYENFIVYASTKLCNLLFTRELSRQLHGTGVTAYGVHPGFVATNIWRDLRFPLKQIFNFVLGLIGKTSEEGAQPLIYCAVDEQIANSSGEYYEECAVSTEAERGRDDAVAKKLWEVSERITGLLQ